MTNLKFYGICIILSSFELRVISIEDIKVDFDGTKTTCSTSEIFPIAFEDINFQQFKGYHKNYRSNEEENLRCNLGDDEFCDSWWLVKNWNRGNSIKRHFKEIITDIRWQEFKPLLIKDHENGRNIFTKLIKLEDERFHVPISWKVSGDVDLYFCAKRNIEDSECYWVEILLEKNKIKLRRCLAGTLPKQPDDIPSGKCETIMKEQNITTTLDVNKWAGLLLMKTPADLSLYYISNRNGSPDLVFKFTTTKDFLNIRYIFGHSKKGDGIVKVHDYNFLQTTKAGFHQIGPPFRVTSQWLCLSIYVAMCRNCRMIFMMSGHILADISFSDEGSWRRIKMYVTNSKNTYEQLYVQTIGNELYTANNYWAIDYMQLCQGRHFIILSGPRKYSCNYVNPTIGLPPLKYNVSLSKIPLGFSSNEVDDIYFQIISKNKTTIKFRCQLGKNISVSSLTLELTCRDRSDLKLTEYSRMVALQKCEFWQHFYCGIVDVNGEKVNCTLKVARKPRSAGERAYFGDTIYFTNSEEASLEPNYVIDSYDSTDSGTQIGFHRPINSNGELKGFEITYTGAKIKKELISNHFSQRFKDNEESYKLEHHIRVKNLSYEPCTAYFLQVRAVNNYGPGFASTKLVYSPPLLPNDLKIKKLVESSNTADFSIRTLPKKHLTNPSHIISQYILVLLFGSKDKCRDLEVSKLTDNVGLKNVTHIAREFDLSRLENNISVIFTIGDGTTGRSKYLNCYFQNNPLETNRVYDVAFLAVSYCAEKVKYFPYKFNVIPGRTEKRNLNITIVFYIILSIIWFLVGLITAISYNRYRKQKRPNMMFEMTRRPTTVDNIYSLSRYPSVLSKIAEEDKEELLELQTNELESFGNSSKEKLGQRKPIKIVEFENYLKNAVLKQLEEQFFGLPKGFLRPCENGKLESNKPKNRFNNVIPYDDNRVIIQRSIGNENTDYINASYIKGFKNDKTYIAAQGPRALTINDFWQMIWQDNVRYIIMLVNLEEFGHKKVEKYWPNHNEDFQFGNIHVFHHSAELMADYEIKIFKIICDGQQRKIFHYHFLSWPDQGVPIHYHNLLPFIRKTLEISSKSPVVVHCCSGTAATAVFILCDICLRTARVTGVVDVLKVAHELRKQRINMIENIVHYKLAHLLLMEILTGLQSVISCSDDIDKFTVKLTGPDELTLQMQYLDDTVWQMKVLAVTPELFYPFEVFSVKNRTKTIVPDATGAIQLRRYPPSDKASAYINAVKVDGYRHSDKYVVTQQPMPNTLNDFWRMIVLLNIETIISLNEVNLTDINSCEFWPTEQNPQMSPVDFIILNYSSSTEYDNFDKIVVHVLVEGKEKMFMKVVILSLKGWLSHDLIPNDLHSFLKFHGYADAVSKQFPLCAVTCYDGNIASGVFVATSYLLEKIKLEKCYDVCEAIRVIRKNRKQFISEKVQLAYLYEIACTYIKGFNTYANFSQSSNTFVNIYDYIE